MKTLIFIVLKIVEIISAVALYCGISYFGYWVPLDADFSQYHWYSPVCFIWGLAICLVVSGILVLLYCIGKEMIPLNKKWAGSIYKKIKP
jgi:hypothetical protein